MDVEGRLRDDLGSLSEGIRAPASAARDALAAARRHQHRRRTAVAGLALVLAGGGSLAVVVHASDQRAPQSVLGATPAAAGAMPADTHTAELAAPNPPDVVDGVSFVGLPKGWTAALGLSARTISTGSGRQTFHDIAWSSADADHNIVLSVQRGDTADIAQFAQNSIAAGTATTLAPGSDADHGIATSPGAPTAAGYKVLGPKVFVVIWGPPQYLSSILDNTRELG